MISGTSSQSTAYKALRDFATPALWVSHKSEDPNRNGGFLFETLHVPYGIYQLVKTYRYQVSRNPQPTVLSFQYDFLVV